LVAVKSRHVEVDQTEVEVLILEKGSLHNVEGVLAVEGIANGKLRADGLQNLVQHFNVKVVVVHYQDLWTSRQMQRFALFQVLSRFLFFIFHLLVLRC